MLYGLIILVAAFHAHSGAFRTRGVGHFLVLLSFLYWGLSYCNGYDWINYFSAVECERLGNCDEAYVSFEPFFLMLTKVASWTDYQLIPLAAGTAGALTIRRLQQSLPMSGYAVLYLLSVTTFYLYIEQVRQGMALALLFIAADRLGHRQWKPAFWFWIAAMQFHWTSALFVIPAFLTLANRRQIVLVTATLAGLLALTLLFLDELVALALQPPWSELSLFKRIFFYAATEDYNTAAIGLGFAIDVGMLLLVLLAGKGIGVKPGFNLRFTVLCYFVLLLVSRLNIAIYRISLVFLPFVCLYLTQIADPHAPSLRALGGARISRRIVGLILVVLCIGQATRPFTDPVLKPAVLHHELFGLTAIPSDTDRQLRAIAACDLLDQFSKGFLCGRW